MHRSALAPFALSLATLVGCSGSASDTSQEEGAFSSNQATLLDFEFDSELITDATGDDDQIIQGQLLYTIGHLNTQESVGRLDKVTLSNKVRTPLPGALWKISYSAKLPVAWASKTNLPSSYELMLPREVTPAALSAFTKTHKDTCVDRSAHDVDVDSMWYFYRPRAEDCAVSEPEIVKCTAKVTMSAENTTGKYPEYQEIWADNRLEIVSIFGKDKAENLTNDVGINGFNNYVATTNRELRALGATVTSTPADVGDRPGPQINDVSIEAELADGKVVKVTALLVNAVTDVPTGFNARYESLTPTADVISYNGHAGLGQNVRALARKGHWVANKYQVFFMNGCDTFAYVDGSLAKARAVLNPDDPSGTKYMEFVTNAMPSFFSSMPAASTALMKGFLSYVQPKTYDQIFEAIDTNQVVLVTGEEDNVFRPGMPIGPRP